MQVLRFSTATSWSELSDERRTQLAFNAGVMALGLGLSKEEGYDVLAAVCQGKRPLAELHAHVRGLMAERGMVIDEAHVCKPF